MCEQRNGSELSSLDDCDGDDDADGFRLADSDADDEFECDCPVCLMHQQHISGICIWQYARFHMNPVWLYRKRL